MLRSNKGLIIKLWHDFVQKNPSYLGENLNANVVILQSLVEGLKESVLTNVLVLFATWSNDGWENKVKGSYVSTESDAFSLSPQNRCFLESAVF